MKRLIAQVLVIFLLAVPAHAALNIQKVTSKGGITAWLVEEHSIPFTALEIRFKGGTSLDLPGKRGATYMMAGLLEEGAGDMTATQFQTARDALAADFNFAAHGDSVSISAKFLSENRDQAMSLLKQAIEAPRFDPEAIKRVRAQILSLIARNKKDPQEIASSTFDRLAYGDHPYGSSSTGTIKSVSSLGRDDLVTAYRNSMARDRVYVSAVGDITPEQLGVLMDELLGGLPAKGAPMPPKAKIVLTGGVTVVHFPSPQSVAIFGERGIERTDPDFFAAYVMNRIFGGDGFDARLTREVRVKRGLTYGVYSYLADFDLASMLQGSVSSDNDRMAEALDVIRAEWKKMADKGATQAELDAAKKYLTGAYPLRFDGNGRIAAILAGMQLDGLPASYVKTRNARINAVTLADVARVAKRLLRPKDLRIVVVGQPVGVKSTD